MRRAVSCELPHETFLEIGSWYEETGLAEDARRIFRLALPNPEAEMRLAFLEHRPPVLGMRVEGAFPFRRESRPALEAAAGRDGWKAKYLLAVLKGFFHETEASSALLESCGDEPDESVFYLMSRGIPESEARAMIVSGFANPVSKELPLEYAAEMNNLIKLEMETG